MTFIVTHNIYRFSAFRHWTHYDDILFSVCVCMCMQLLDLQLSDSNFRRCILLQYLILFHYLNAQVRFKTLVPFICFIELWEEAVILIACLCICLYICHNWQAHLYMVWLLNYWLMPGFIYPHTNLTALFRTTLVSQYQKGKTNLDFTETRDSEWQWHQLGHMQVCTMPAA